MPERVRVVPSARRLVQSLRDLGYELPDAVADIVDNSIAARATKVWVDVGFEADDSWIRITDNGKGMSGAVLTEAMRFGSETTYDEDDLGKYGLGLKTASSSQCRRLTVATRHANGSGRTEVRRFDLDDVIKRNEWDIERLRMDECRSELLEPLNGHKGTVVMWERLDRVLRFARPGAAENWLLRLCREMERHLAMVFHRFLSGDAGRKLPLKIYVNDNPIAPWDPYCRDEPRTKELDARKLTLERGRERHVVRVESFILPNKAQFSDVKAFEDAGGPKKWNRQQGFYIYRGDRMIQSGGWNRLRAPDEHTKLARIAVLFDRDSDELFDINVSKMRVSLPAELRDDFDKIATEVAKRADAAYRQGDDDAPRKRATRARDSSGAGAVAEPRSRYDERRDANVKILKRVMQVLENELGDRPRILKSLLLALARIDPVFAATRKVSE
jgi:hypothetical protein